MSASQATSYCYTWSVLSAVHVYLNHIALDATSDAEMQRVHSGEQLGYALEYTFLLLLCWMCSELYEHNQHTDM